MSRPKIGAERWLVEMISTPAVEAMARKQGWPGDEGLREFCEPEDAAQWAVYSSLERAITAARAWLATGQSFYGCAIVDRQVFERWHDDRGNRVNHADWERKESYEVADEVILVNR